MRNGAYYKTNDPAVMAALQERSKQVRAVLDAGKAFANAFGGGDVIWRNDSRGTEFIGVRFEPKKDARLWTHPDPKQNGIQRPRNTLQKATPDEKAELKALREKWNAEFPRIKYDMGPLLAAMGTDWGNLLFAGFGMFQHGGFLWVTTGAKLGPCMVEVLASEYKAAKAAFDASKGKK